MNGTQNYASFDELYNMTDNQGYMVSDNAKMSMFELELKRAAIRRAAYNK